MAETSEIAILVKARDEASATMAQIGQKVDVTAKEMARSLTMVGAIGMTVTHIATRLTTVLQEQGVISKAAGDSIRTLTTAMQALFSTMTAVGGVAMFLSSAIGVKLVSSITAAVAAAGGLSGVLSPMLGPIGLITAGLSLLAIVGVRVWQGIRDETKHASEAFDEYLKKVQLLNADVADDVKDKWRTAHDQRVSQLESERSTAESSYRSQINNVEELTEAYNDQLQALEDRYDAEDSAAEKSQQTRRMAELRGLMDQSLSVDEQTRLAQEMYDLQTEMATDSIEERRNKERADLKTTYDNAVQQHKDAEQLKLDATLARIDAEIAAEEAKAMAILGLSKQEIAAAEWAATSVEGMAAEREAAVAELGPIPWPAPVTGGGWGALTSTTQPMGVSAQASRNAEVWATMQNQADELERLIAAERQIWGAGALSGITNWAAGLVPALASGGIVNKPTLAMVGEHGREAVVPLDRGGNVGATYNITVNVDYLTGDRAGAKRLADALMPEIRARQRYAWGTAGF